MQHISSPKTSEDQTHPDMMSSHNKKLFLDSLQRKINLNENLQNMRVNVLLATTYRRLKQERKREIAEDQNTATPKMSKVEV